MALVGAQGEPRSHAGAAIQTVSQNEVTLDHPRLRRPGSRPAATRERRAGPFRSCRDNDGELHELFGVPLAR
jgi:hypothetical protein